MARTVDRWRSHLAETVAAVIAGSSRTRRDLRGLTQDSWAERQIVNCKYQIPLDRNAGAPKDDTTLYNLRASHPGRVHLRLALHLDDRDID